MSHPGGLFAAQAAQGGQTTTAAPAWPAGFSEAPRLLLVDDEANILNALRRLLRPLGYEITLAGSGEEALALLDEARPDLVISDMRMPGMQGAQLLAAVRERDPSIMRVLLTGYAEVASAVAAINEGGVYRYISKPWDDGLLIGTLQQALEVRGLARERQRLQALTEEQNAQLKELNATLEQKVLERTAALQTAHQELTLAMEKLDKNYFASVQMLSQLIELRAPKLAGHGRRVADVARKIAENMDLPKAEVRDILLAGLLHDIGKIGYSDELMLKPIGRMTADELGVMRKHPLAGEAALMSMPDLREVARIIRHHHERWDGKGFPDALSGDAIPRGSRVLALANDYDAAQLGLLSQKPMTVDEARQYVIEGSRFRYDPDVVDAFARRVGLPPPRKAAGERRIAGAQAEVGMVLSRDLYGPDGILLLATDYVLDDLLVKQIREYERSLGKPLVICVRTD